jgi:hypothetical protein
MVAYTNKNSTTGTNNYNPNDTSDSNYTNSWHRYYNICNFYNDSYTTTTSTYLDYDYYEYSSSGLGVVYKMIMAWLNRHCCKYRKEPKLIFKSIVLLFKRFIYKTAKSLTQPIRFKGWKFSR